MYQSIFWAAVIAGLLFVHPVHADDRVAIEFLEKIGAIVKRNDSQVERPVAMISINLRELTADGLTALKEIETLPAVEFLGAGDTAVTKETLQALQGKPSLKSLAISFAKIGDDSANVLGTLKGLESLDLHAQIEISVVGLDEIFNLKNLKELTLSDRLVRDDVLEDLVKFPHLKVLSIRSVFVTDDGIASLRRLNNLRTLRIYLGPDVTDVGMRRLAEFELAELDLTYFDVTDDKLKELRKLSGLKSLRMINAAKVTDEAIPYLAELTDLKSLDIADAKITKTGFKQLKKMLPKCSIACIGKKRK